MTDTTPTPEAVERFDPPRNGAWEHLPMRVDIAGQYVRYRDYDALLARVDALTKERDEAEDRANAFAAKEMRTEADLAAALAASGAVAEAMREACMAILTRYMDDGPLQPAPTWSAVETQTWQGGGLDHLLAAQDVIRALPIPADAAAALAEHDRAIWLRVRDVLLSGQDWDVVIAGVKAAILARKEGK